MPTKTRTTRYRSGTKRRSPSRAKRTSGAKAYRARSVSRASAVRAPSSQGSREMVSVRRYPGRGRTTRSFGPRWSNPLSQSKNVKFQYADTGFALVTQGSLGIFATQVFRGNSAFDPHESGVGVQPYGFDALCNATNYSIYRVVASRIEVTFYPLLDTGTEISNVVFTLVPSIASALTYTGTDDLRVMPWAKQRYWSEVRAPFKMVAYATNRQLFGCAVPGADAGEAATYNTNPYSKWRWHIFADSTSTAEDVDIKCDVKITYYTQLVRTDDQDES